MVRWQRAKARISEGLDAWKALRAERRQLLADKVVKEVEEKEAKWWVDVLKMMERQMQGGRPEGGDGDCGERYAGVLGDDGCGGEGGEREHAGVDGAEEYAVRGHDEAACRVSYLGR